MDDEGVETIWSSYNVSFILTQMVLDNKIIDYANAIGNSTRSYFADYLVDLWGLDAVGGRLSWQKASES